MPELISLKLKDYYMDTLPEYLREAKARRMELDCSFGLFTSVGIKTFEAPVSPDAFSRYYELHPQGRKISFKGEEEIYNAQSGCCTFVPRRNNKVLKLDQIEICYSQKNEWDDDWAQYWFYSKIAFPSVSDSVESIFPLASKVMPFQHVNQPGFNKSLSEFKDCDTAFREVAKFIRDRDLVEEYLAAKIWPLTFG
jgi:hypothetical protein